MKYILSILTSFSVLFLGVAGAYAAPNNAVNNPNIVANYDSGTHGVVGENATHTGSDVVMAAGQSGNFQQWFYGTSTENGGNTEGDHSLFQLSKDGSCPSGTYPLTVSTDPNSSNFWGDYLQNGATYCVRTNDFHVSN